MSNDTPIDPIDITPRSTRADDITSGAAAGSRHPRRLRSVIPGVAVTAVVVSVAITGCSDDVVTAPTRPATAPSATSAPAPTATPSAAADAPATSLGSRVTVASSPTDEDAAAFCVDHGGTVESRQPYLNTNLDQSQWVQLPGTIELCRFESDDADTSRIYIDTLSLASPTPTLAAAAYLAGLPLPDDVGGANPAAVNCVETVHGTTSWGTGANGGGWVNLDDPVFTVVDLCVFSDRSAVDQWGIAYYAGGITRGADLATVFPFQPSAAATIFPPHSGS